MSPSSPSQRTAKGDFHGPAGQVGRTDEKAAVPQLALTRPKRLAQVRPPFSTCSATRTERILRAFCSSAPERRCGHETTFDTVQCGCPVAAQMLRRVPCTRVQPVFRAEDETLGSWSCRDRLRRAPLQEPRPSPGSLARDYRQNRPNFHYSITAYGPETEPGMPGLKEGVETFLKPECQVRARHVCCRYDPVLLTGNYDENGTWRRSPGWPSASPATSAAASSVSRCTQRMQFPRARTQGKVGHPNEPDVPTAHTAVRPPPRRGLARASR